MKRSERVSRVPVGLAYLAVFMAGGCTERRLHPETTFDLQKDAASVILSATLVEHWEDYAKQLDPKFTLSGDEALDKVLPPTLELTYSLSRESSLKLSFGKLPEAPGSGAGEDEADAGESAEETSAEKKSKDDRPGKGAEAAAPEGGGEGETEADEGEGKGSDEGKEVAAPSLSRDPVLEYQVATGLFQEVQLLNKYVTDAALKHEATPYIVRFQIGVIPYARNMPYDVYTTIGFFPGLPDEELEENPAAKRCEAGRWRAEEPGGEAPKRGTDGGAPERPAPNPYAPTLVVIPLLITDNLEAALNERNVETIRELTAAVSTSKVSGEAKRRREEKRSAKGADLNALMTVGRVTDNTLVVRLGASNQATPRYGMIPRTHYVTALLLVPKEGWDWARPVHMRATTTMLHPKTGEALAQVRPDALSSRYQEALTASVNQSVPGGQECHEQLQGETALCYLEAFILYNQYEAFRRRVRALGCAGNAVSTTGLWVEMAEALQRRERTSARFYLPRTKALYLPPPQVARAFNRADEEPGIVVKLAGGTGLDVCPVSASLVQGWEFKGKSALIPVFEEGDNVRYMAPLVRRDTNGEFVAVFLAPTLDELGGRRHRLWRLRLGVDNTRVKWEGTCESGEGEEERWYRVDVRSPVKPPKKTGKEEQGDGS